jgi:hypothetical protein
MYFERLKKSHYSNIMHYFTLNPNLLFNRASLSVETEVRSVAP